MPHPSQMSKMGFSVGTNKLQSTPVTLLEFLVRNMVRSEISSAVGSSAPQGTTVTPATVSAPPHPAGITPGMLRLFVGISTFQCIGHAMID